MHLLFWRAPPIPVIELHGVLSGRDGSLNLRGMKPIIEKAFRSAGKSNPKIVLDIDSPGGSPVQSDLIASLIRRLAEERQVTVYAAIGEVGASGGYWLACAADDIRANPMSIVGSIGVVGGGFGVPELLARHGVERRIYTAGENKARLDPFSPERPQDVAFVQKLLNDIHDRFKAWVRARRGQRLAPEQDVFDGSFWLGDEAKALGLVDGFADVAGLVRELGGDRAQPRYFRPRRRRLLARLTRGALAGAVEFAIEERGRLARLT